MKRNPIVLIVLLILLGVSVAYWFSVRGHTIRSPIAPPKPPAPVEITYRKALLGDGYVFTLKSTSDRSRTFLVSLQNPTTKARKNFSATIDTRQSKEIGHLEGWTAASGDTIEVTSDGYAAKQSRIP